MSSKMNTTIRIVESISYLLSYSRRVNGGAGVKFRASPQNDLYLRRFDRKTASIWPKRTCHIGHTFSAKKESAEL
jgi:hypothetical protein